MGSKECLLIGERPSRGCSSRVIRFPKSLRDKACAVFSQAGMSILFSKNNIAFREFAAKARKIWTFRDRPIGGIAPSSVICLWIGCTRLKTRVLRGGVFSLTRKIKRVKTQSFFDSFLSFTGWCGVRGSSKVTFLTARSGKRASKGL
jgi:hypothetical protein